MAEKIARPKVIFNGKQIESELDKLTQKSNELKKALKDAFKAKSDPKEIKKLQKGIKAVEKESRSLKKEMMNVDRVIKDINGESFSNIKKAFLKQSKIVRGLRKDAKNYNTELAKQKTLKGAMTSFNKGLSKQGLLFKKLIGLTAGFFAVGKVISFAKENLKLYDIQKKSEAELLVALDGRKSAQEDLIKQASELQEKTLFGDEETIKAQALIAAFVEEKDQIKEVIPLVQDLATAKNMKLSAAADLVSKTLGSSTNALARYGIEVKGAVGSNERLASLTNNFAKAFKGQAEAAAKAGAGGLTQLENSWGDLREVLGGKLLENMGGFISLLKKGVNVIQSWVEVPISEKLKEEQAHVNALAFELTDLNTNEKRRKEILIKLNKIAPQVAEGLNAQNINVGKLNENLKKYNETIVKTIILEGFKKSKIEEATKVAEASVNLGKAELDLRSKMVEINKNILETKDTEINRLKIIKKQLDDQISKEEIMNTQAKAAAGMQVSITSKAKINKKEIQ